VKVSYFFIWLILLFLGIGIVNSQDKSKSDYTLSGTVYDSDNSPVELVQILVQTPNKVTLAYGFTNQSGAYSLTFSTQQDTIILSASRIGYTAVFIKTPTNIGSKDIVLSISPNSQLSEITVTDKGPIEDSGDTLAYFVSKFIDGSEKTVEDVIAKLPGFSIDTSTGKIKYQGKEIKKILLDGDDLTGNNYTVLSKNLSADWLEEVEVLKRFSDSRLLQGIEQSDDVALNLKLKEDVKAPIFGNLMAGIGTTQKYTSKVELLSYLKKVKLFAVGTSNNIGRDLETYDLETYTSRQLQYRGFLSAGEILNTELSPPTLLNEDNFIFHQGYFASNSFVARPSSKLSIRSVTTVYDNNRTFNFLDSLFYILPNQSGFSLTQQQNQNQKPFQLFQDLKIDYMLNEKTDISSRWQLKTNNDFINSINKTSLSQDILENSSNESYQLFGNLSYIKKINNKWASTTDAQFGIENQKENINLRENEDNANDSLFQSINQRYYNIGLFQKVNGILSENLYLNALIGASSITSRFDATSFLEDMTNPISDFDDDYSFKSLFADISLKKKWKSISLLSGARIRQVWLGYNLEKSNRFLLEPTLSISVENKIFESLKFTTIATYNREYVFLKPNNLYSSSLINSFRTIKSYNANPANPLENDLFIFSVKMQDFQKKNITATIELVYEESNEILVNNLFFDEAVVINNQIQGGNSQTFFSKYSFDKYISKLKTTIKLSYEYNLITTPQVIEENFDNNLLSQNIIGIKSGTYLGSGISLSLGFEHNNNTNKWRNTETNFEYQNYFVKIVCKPFSLINMSFNIQTVDFGKSRGGFSSVVGTKLDYSTKNGKIDFGLEINNLMNNSAVVINRLDSFSFSSTNYPLLKRFLLLSLEFKF
jgi:hypothetical protein